MCRDCRAGRPVAYGIPGGPLAALDPLDLAALYESSRAAYRRHAIGWDEPAFAAARAELERRVRRHGGFVAAGVRYGWDFEGEQLSRSDV